MLRNQSHICHLIHWSETESRGEDCSMEMSPNSRNHWYSVSQRAHAARCSGARRQQQQCLMSPHHVSCVISVRRSSSFTSTVNDLTHVTMRSLLSGQEKIQLSDVFPCEESV